ncbi:T9SS type A sorting domain-containing protein [Prevotella sp.]|uniref:T9SS type A sorting domain-containing protein n=1 Tax=Prevotella sp. TaxID=59823 RepID=UPI002F9445DD
MKKIIITLIVLVCSITHLSAQSPKSLIVSFNDGTTQLFALSALPDIKMENNKMTITAGSAVAEYELYKIKSFTFSGTATDIKDIVQQNGLTIEGNQLIIPGKNADVSVYSMNGNHVNIMPTRLPQATILNLESLPKGFYIIKANGKSTKITKR